MYVVRVCLCCSVAPCIAVAMHCAISAFHGQMKMDVLRFLTSEVFTEEDIILLLLVATGDTRQRYIWRVIRMYCLCVCCTLQFCDTLCIFALTVLHQPKTEDYLFCSMRKWSRFASIIQSFLFISMYMLLINASWHTRLTAIVHPSF